MFDLDRISPAPLIQEKKKYQEFKITPIGGPDEIIEWRKIQAAKEAAYKIRLTERDDRLLKFERDSNQKLATPTIHTTSWEEKLMFAKSERKRLANLDDVVTQANACVMSQEPKPKLFQRLKIFMWKLWDQANF